MKRMFVLTIIAVVFVFSVQAHAELFDRGTDIAGNHLIYDDDFDITWYDFTNSAGTWQNQVDWAAALDVDYGGTHYTDWRLPSTVDGTFVWSYDGTTTAGFNNSTSEMGHLYYTELANKGLWAVDGTNPQPGWGLINTGDFQNLKADAYWSGMEYSDDTDYAWAFQQKNGFQGNSDKDNHLNALAVRSGDVPVVVPEPMSMILFGVGGVVMAARRKLLEWRHG